MKKCSFVILLSLFCLALVTGKTDHKNNIYRHYNYDDILIVMDSLSGELVYFIDNSQHPPFVEFYASKNSADLLYDITSNKGFYYLRPNVKYQYKRLAKHIHYCPNSEIIETGDVLYDDFEIDSKCINRWYVQSPYGIKDSIYYEHPEDRVFLNPETKKDTAGIKNGVVCEYNTNNYLNRVMFYKHGTLLFLYILKNGCYLRLSNIKQTNTDKDFTFEADVRLYKDVSASVEYFANSIFGMGKAVFNNMTFNQLHAIGLWTYSSEKRDTCRYIYETPELINFGL